MQDYIYDIGPWVRDAEQRCWVPPRGTVGSICFGSLPDCRLSVDVTDHRPRGFFARDPSTGSLGLDYLTVGRGDCRDLKPDEEMRKSAAGVMGVSPDGDTLVSWLADWLFRTGSSDGSDRWKIGTPTREGNKEIYLSGHSKIFEEKFAGEADKSWNRLRDLLRYDLDQHDKECKAEAKRLKDAAKELRKQKKNEEADACDSWAAKVENHAEKVLDAMIIKYKCLQSELSTTIRRGKASTAISDNFNRADGTTIGNQLTWAETNGNWTTSSNRVTVTGGDYYDARAESDLSGADHYSQVVVTVAGQPNIGGSAIRFSSSARTYYAFRPTVPTNPGTQYLGKWVNGSLTWLFNASFAVASGDTMRCHISGTTLSGLVNAVSKVSGTDSAISGGTRTGILSYDGFFSNVFLTSFYATDLITGWTHKIHGVAAANMAKVHGTAKANIGKIHGV